VAPRSLGMKLDGIPTEEVVALAPEIERAGLDQVWVCEDLGRNGGIAQAALALAATSRCRVGLGILPAAVRNPAYMAMEIASLCRAHPGRFIPGIGHGMPGWLRQVDAHPGRLLPRLEEVTVVARQLLEGRTVDFSGEGVRVEDVSFQFPPAEVPPILWGVRGPKGIELAGRVADGLILAEGSGPDYIRDARERFGARRPTVVAFAWFAVDDDAERARAQLRDTVAAALEWKFMRAQLGPLAEAGDVEAAIGELTVSGTPADCAAAIERLWDAGADSVVLQAPPGSERPMLARMGAILEALGSPGNADHEEERR
jgi:5,10-methylenetetrahydromethanopterin reductase